ncbi:MotA/TolQ/ExbB proton channel family protein [Ornithobacterium rhinotracheale]|uniref:MotA/TolQ/ExbB proton channel family protein n=1 Tax=Ornithobacterium rhinotracheale TaxID=28251 RepID=UPI00129C793F|nr:MotA/TolQ/ExbB proton channel family protein [Ornithobacterium rhinotracheale]MRI63214.1 MotA/TolQ/ExbB proton channel family protein [Ornithobacterium rhinotracheale]MRJ08861.1 MotA/TolQ/ExbB proton channel family protein [Ornithobacterium rhinotracheale]MRJ10041.1 MotA/TolQ/ExbB proton channel family protein [Ornithobacterium rhinotracheale]UOH77742.1 MotA/TolQ/ExbB proton channel family protein [Ornithobacterium rhinotracheale]
MKKRFSLLAMAGIALTSMQANAAVFAQAAQAADAAPAEESQSPIYVLKEFFVMGGPFWMTLPLICLILGLAFAIERMLYLNAADVNTTKLLSELEDALNSGGIESAKDVARDKKGPVASIAYQALLRVGDGQPFDDVERSVVGYGGVEVGKLERNLSWIGLFIAIAPMLGFMGTVVGMVMAFQDIAKSGSVQAQDMAGNIQVALLTTLAGLVVAIVLQIFYNYLTAKIDSIVNKMEDASISIMDMLVRYRK